MGPSHEDLGREESYSHAGVRVRERRHTLPPRQHGLKEETVWTGEDTLQEAGESWTPSSPAYKISVFISKGTCAEAVGEEKRETKEIGGGGKESA